MRRRNKRDWNGNQKDLRKLDKNSPEYWNEVLRREGLTMQRGTDGRKLLYTDRSETIHAEDFFGGRRVLPKPACA